ncbi:MAG: extracellular solute-binding protein [Oscillospiraceae bacterium]|nr:extracellular solute-binding protein [Oscillospiraceae bacterium]
MKTNRIVKTTAIALLACMAASFAGCSASSQAQNSAPAASAQSAAGAAEQKADTDYANMSIDELKEAAKKESGKIVVSAWWGEDFWQKFAQSFEKKYGIKVEISFGDSQPVLDKVIMEKDADASTIDAMLLGGANAKIAMDANVMYPNILNAIEGKEELDPGLCKMQEGVIHKGTFVPIYLNQTGILYNPQKVSESELPQTWEDLEKYIDSHPGKFAFNNPTKGGSGQAFVHTAINILAGGVDQYTGDTEVVEDKIKDWQKVWDWINARKDKLTITNSNSESIAKVNSGECDMAAAWDDDSVNAMKKGELMKDAKLYIPKFKMAGGGDTMGVVKNSANKASAILFVNELASKEGQIQMNKVLCSLPARSGISVDTTLLSQEDMKENRISWFPSVYKKRMNEDFVEKVLMQ